MSQPCQWSVEQYHHLAELGVFDDERVELLDGAVWCLGGQSPLHAAVVSKARQVLQDIFGIGFVFSLRMPISLSDTSEPEPDFSVAVGIISDYADHHPGPSEVLLVVDVADCVLEKDRGIKREIYARAGIVEYWLVNLVSHQLEVCRKPIPSGTYTDFHVYLPGEIVVPISLPAKAVAVDDLLPPVE